MERNLRNMERAAAYLVSDIIDHAEAMNQECLELEYKKEEIALFSAKDNDIQDAFICKKNKSGNYINAYKQYSDDWDMELIYQIAYTICQSR